MNNNLIKMQSMLMRQMERLDDNNQMKNNGRDEIARANALSQNATTFIKTINVGLRITEMQLAYKINEEKLKEKIGI